MAVTQNTYTGNGSTQNYVFSFNYLNPAHVKATINGTPTTAFTFFNASTLRFNTAPANGAAIRIYRETPSSALLADFTAGTAIREVDLEFNFQQVLNVAQETENIAIDSATSVQAAVTAANAASAAASAAAGQAATALSTANAALASASSVVGIANAAGTAAADAVATANAASVLANAAASAISSVLPSTLTANLTTLAGLTPVNNGLYEVSNTTGAGGSSLVSGWPGGLTGSSALSARFQYNSSTSKYEYRSYFPNDPESRYAPASISSTVSTAQTTANNAQSAANAAQTTANAALPKAGGTMTGTITFAGGQTFPGVSGGRSEDVVVFAASGSWVCPSDVTNVTAIVVGGGGGSRNLVTGSATAGAGAVGIGSVAVTPGTTYTITVGAGGAGVVSGTGNSGGTSSFGALISCPGGTGSGSAGANGINGVCSSSAANIRRSNSADLAVPYIGGQQVNVITTNNAAVTWSITSALQPGAPGTVTSQLGLGGVSGAVILIF